MTWRLATPWAPRSRIYSLPGSLILRLALGEAPEGVPPQLEVTRGESKASNGIDGGPIDRLIRHHAGGARITRVHASVAAVRHPRKRRAAWDDVEQATGVSRTFRVDVDPGAPISALVDSLSQLSTVDHAYPHYTCMVPLELPSAVSDVTPGWDSREMVSAAGAMAYESGDPATIVGIVDSGVAPQHEEMTERLRSGFDTVQLGTSDLAMGVRLLGDRTRMDRKPVDRFVGHGMGCAGIIGALGKKMPPGLAGDCPMLPMRVLGAAMLPGRTQAVGIGGVGDIDCGVKMAVDLGASVLNLSFGTADAALDPQAPKPHRDVVEYALARNCILVAASGNSGTEEIYWPAALEGVIAVGSVDAVGRVSTFSTKGPHVALCAPGERVFTASHTGYQLATGTSFAAPFVTAAAALLVSRAERRSYVLQGAQAREILMSTTRPFTGTAPRGCGTGILDAEAALHALDREIDAWTPEASDNDE